MRRKKCNCSEDAGVCPFIGGETSMGPVVPLYKKGQMGRCDMFNPKYQCPHYPRLENRPGRSLMDRIFGR